jgi:RNA polymerase sigma factor (sigma-70 family)
VASTNKSLLLQIRAGQAAAWEHFVHLYQPLIRGWLLKHLVQLQEADDLTQDVLTLVLEHIGRFEHGGHEGSFRSWLRTVTVNRAREFWRAGKLRIAAAGGSAFLDVLGQLEDPNSELSAEWNLDHDQHVLRRLLATLETDFEPATVQVFRRLVFDGVPAPQVAAAAGMTVAAVYGTKSRVLRRLREEAAGLLD